MVHNGALELITEITGLHANAARTVAINIQTHINDTIVKIYQHARDAKRPPAPRPSNYTLEEQEQQLGALYLLLTGAETLQEYRDVGRDAQESLKVRARQAAASTILIL
mgnify:CR=1 FL=1